LPNGRSNGGKHTKFRPRRFSRSLAICLFLSGTAQQLPKCAFPSSISPAFWPDAVHQHRLTFYWQYSTRSKLACCILNFLLHADEMSTVFGFLFIPFCSLQFKINAKFAVNCNYLNSHPINIENWACKSANRTEFRDLIKNIKKVLFS